MTEIPSVQPYSGDMPNRAEQDRDTFANNIYAYITWAGTTFLNAFNLAIDKINILSGEINTTATDIQANKDYVADAKATIENTMGTSYGGTWNDTDDFKDKTVSYNGALWVGLDSDVGNSPTWNNSKWLFLNEITNYKNVTANVTANMGDILLVDATNTTSTIEGVAVIEITLPSPAPNTHVRYIDIKGLFEGGAKGVRLKTVNANDTVMGLNTNDDTTAIVTDNKNASRTLIAVESGNNFDWRFV